MDDDANGKLLDLDCAVALMQGGVRFGDVYPDVAPADRDELRRVFVTDPSCGPRQKSETATRPVLPTATGDTCKKCGGMLVRAGKCLYCPLGCGSEGECS